MNNAIRNVLIGLSFIYTNLVSAASVQTLTVRRYPEAMQLNPNLSNIIEKTFALAGLQLVWHDVPLKRSLVSANKGIMDGDIGRVYWAVNTLQNLRAVTEPLSTVQFWIMVPPIKIAQLKTNSVR